MDKELHAIIAMANKGVIGHNNRLPWHMPADLAHFKALTSGHAIVMGRKTFESIGKALPNRENYILTRQKNYQQQGCYTINHLDQCPHQKIFIIGGSELLTNVLGQITQLYLTKIHADIEGDTFFHFDESEWHTEKEEHYQQDDKNPFDYSFYTLVRRK